MESIAPDRIARRLERRVQRHLASHARVVLAVSGGLDSMAMLHAASTAVDASRLVVATFDHASGPTAREAAALVEREARRRGLIVRSGRAEHAVTTEAAWRDARWAFLRTVAGAERAVVATAHTRDDQLETIVLRLLRGAGARGLAGLDGNPGVARPFRHVARADVRSYAAALGLPYVDDPSNTSFRHARNRLRLDLLPALETACPGFAEEMLALGDRAAALRADLDAVARRVTTTEPARHAGGVLSVRRDALARFPLDSLRVLWPAIAARAGVRLDRRGTERLAAFTIRGAAGRRIQLSGGVEVVRWSEHLVVCRCSSRGEARARAAYDRALTGTVQAGAFRFRLLGGASAPADSPWIAHLAADAVATVRPWHPGDRVVAAGGRPRRRVRRFFAEARVPGCLRPGWPVVLVDGEIVWVPGVCRSDAAAARSGRSVVRYLCERLATA